VAAQLGAEVSVIERDGAGGSAVLTGTVPSKTLIATADVMSLAAESAELGVRLGGKDAPGIEALHPDSKQVAADLARVNARVKRLAQAQSTDITARLTRDGVRFLRGSGRLDGPQRVVATLDDGSQETIEADAILVATGAHPRVLPDAIPDGERILSWADLYELQQLPERLIVIGSGVTGAEFASAYKALGSDVVLVSSREQVLPGEDADAAQVLEDVFARRGMTVLSSSRAQSVKRVGDAVVVALEDGRTVEGSHALMAVGSVANTADLGLDKAGVRLDKSGFIEVDRVSRSSARGVYAAGDCTGVLMLASVAAMQGRIAMWHALGDAVTPLDLKTVSANVFTDPEIATVGYTQVNLDRGGIPNASIKLPLATNARAKMQGVTDGFVKLFCRPGSGIVVGGVVVAPRASELIFPVALAVDLRLNVDQVAHTFTIYPSLTGSIAEAARQLHTRG